MSTTKELCTQLMRSELQALLDKHDIYKWDFSITSGLSGEDINPLVSDYIFELIRNDLEHQKIKIDILSEISESDSFHKGDYRKNYKGDI